MTDINTLSGPVNASGRVKPDTLPHSAFKQGLHALLADRTAMLGLVVLVIALLAAVFAPVIAPYDPDSGDGASILAPPFSPGHVLGADQQGRVSSREFCLARVLRFPRP